MLSRFSKTVADLLPHKSRFFDDNEQLLARQRELAALYVSQPKRTACMTCAMPLPAVALFSKLGAPYFLCDRCGHLNGGHVDSDAFCRAVYTDGGGAAYASTYRSADADAYAARVRDIYAPKVRFLIDGLMACGADPGALTYADLGAGSGYMVAALGDAGLSATGYEVSEAQIAVARAVRPDILIRHREMAAVYGIAGAVNANVVSMVGVLEHLQRPRDILASLKANPEVRYVLVSVPLHSFSVFVELAFPGVMQRHLSGAHTHLYTNRSLSHLEREFGLERVGEWWFGTDMLDLYRSMSVTFGDQAAILRPLIDPLQRLLDEGRHCSEVHLLWRTR